MIYLLLGMTIVSCVSFTIHLVSFERAQRLKLESTMISDHKRFLEYLSSHYEELHMITLRLDEIDRDQSNCDSDCSCC